MSYNPDRLAQMRERETAYRVPCSAMDYDSLITQFSFPQSVLGLRILDIGGGASNMTARLLELGADAYSIDPRYENPRRVYRDVEAYLSRGSLPEGEIIGATQTMAEFRTSILSNPERYINGTMSALPFDDASVDLIISNLAFSELLTRNIQALKRGASESYRVLKPGVELQVIPWGAEVVESILQGKPELLAISFALKSGLSEAEKHMQELGFTLQQEEIPEDPRGKILHALKG